MNEQIRPDHERHGTPGSANGFFDAAPEGNQPVLISSGPYAEPLPVGNLSVGEIRRRFRDRFDLDPNSQAVLDGNDVGDDVTVRPGQALMFVRRAGEKGIPTLTTNQAEFMDQMMEQAMCRRRVRARADACQVSMEGAEAIATSPEGKSARMPLSTLLEKVTFRALGTGEAILPDGVKSVTDTGRLTLWVHETPPAVHRLVWLAADSPVPYGARAKYRTVRLALPYLIILCVFVAMPGSMPMLSSANECFFRTSPLKSLDDELLYPALLNCSKFDPPQGKPLSWICTQHLSPAEIMKHTTPGDRLTASFKALKHCLLETGFNYSSERHECSSWFTESRNVDPRVNTVEAWEAASATEPLFVMEVPWLNTGHSVRQVVERIIKQNQSEVRTPVTTSTLARVIFNHQSAATQPA